MGGGVMDYADLPRHPLRTLEDLQRAGIQVVRLSVCDLHGVCRSKDLPLEVFAETRVCDFVAALFTLDLAGNALDPADSSCGPSTGYPDLRIEARMETLTRLPWEQDTAWCLGDIASDDPMYLYSPCALLERVVTSYRELGMIPIVGPEVEFYLLRQDADGSLQPFLSQPSMVYTTGSRSDPAGLVRILLEMAQRLGLHPLAATSEFSPGQFEITLLHSEALGAADRAFRFRTMVKEVAHRGGLLATFMGKPLEQESGSGLHLHVSLHDEQHHNLFEKQEEEAGISRLAWQFVAGVLAHAPALMAILAPTINAYKRLVPNSFVPLSATWGLDNRTVFVRVPPARGSHTRLEVRGADATANPYLATAAVLLAGLDGIRHQLVPPPMVEGDVSGALLAGEALPRSLDSSLSVLRADHYLVEALGPALVEALCAVKESELRRFQAAVTDWEVHEYAWHL
jgi:glutamine synthetase